MQKMPARKEANKEAKSSAFSSPMSLAVVLDSGSPPEATVVRSRHASRSLDDLLPAPMRDSAGSKSTRSAYISPSLPATVP